MLGLPALCYVKSTCSQLSALQPVMPICYTCIPSSMTGTCCPVEADLPGLCWLHLQCRAPCS